MPYSREHKEKVRNKILKSTVNHIKKHGIQKTSVPMIMKGAGLTHGGFYAHFPNKEMLIKEACFFAVEEFIQSMEKLCEESDGSSKISVVIDHYLSTYHRDNPEIGCVLPAISSEVTLSPLLKNVYTSCLERFIKFICLVGNVEKDVGYALVSLLVGSLTLARAVQDEQISLQILEAGRKQAKQFIF